MSCYIPVIEKLKSLKVGACNSSTISNDTSNIKSNLSKSKACNGNTSTNHLKYSNHQRLQPSSQDTSHQNISTWRSSNTIDPHTSSNVVSENNIMSINQNNYYLNDDTERKICNNPQRKVIGAQHQIHLQQHHFSIPPLPIPSPPPSYHSNGLAGFNSNCLQTQPNENSIARSPPPPYDTTNSVINSSVSKQTNQNLHVLPLPNATNNSLLNYTYQNDAITPHQHLPPRPPKHDGKRSQVRKRDPNGVTIVQQIGSFPNNVPLNIRHNHPTLGLSDVAYQRQHADHGKYRVTSPIPSNMQLKDNNEKYAQIEAHSNFPTSAQKGVLTLGLPSHWKKIPFKKAGFEDNEKICPSSRSQNTLHLSELENKNREVSCFPENSNDLNNTKQSYQTATSDFIHHTYETLGNPSIQQSQKYIVLGDDHRSYRNASKQRNSSLPRRLRKSKTPTPNTTKYQRCRPRSAQDNLISESSFVQQETSKSQSHNANIYANDTKQFDHKMISVPSYEISKFEGSDTNNTFKSGSDQEDDEGIGEGDISTGSKSGGRNTTSSSGASSGGSRSPDDDEDSSRQLVHCVESNVNHVKSANRRYLTTMPSPNQGPPPRHLLPSKLKPSPAFKMHPIPLLKRGSATQQFTTSELAHLKPQNFQMHNSNANIMKNEDGYQQNLHNFHNVEKLRLKGKSAHDNIFMVIHIKNL